MTSTRSRTGAWEQFGRFGTTGAFATSEIHAQLSEASFPKPPERLWLALVVDITGTSANYNHGLAKASASNPEVVFRTGPYWSMGKSMVSLTGERTE